MDTLATSVVTAYHSGGTSPAVRISARKSSNQRACKGIPRVFKEMKDAGLPEPKIVETAANVTVVLYNGKTADENSQTTESATQTSTQKTTLTTTQRVLELMEKDPYITIDQIAASIGITRDGVNYQIKKRICSFLSLGLKITAKKLAAQKFRGTPSFITTESFADGKICGIPAVRFAAYKAASLQ